MYVHTPLITGSDCEGAGEMFQVTTTGFEQSSHDRRTERLITTQDFFNKPTNLTVSGQLNGETYAMAFKKHLYLWTYLPCGEFQHYTSCGRVLDD